MLAAATLLDSIADTLEALDTTSYRWASTEKWQRGRNVDATRQGDRQLEFWLTIDRATLGPRDRLLLDISIVASVRLTPRNDYLDVGRGHTAALTVLNALDRWTNQTARCNELSYTLTPQPGGEWGTIEITGTIIVADWR